MPLHTQVVLCRALLWRRPLGQLVNWTANIEAHPKYFLFQIPFFPPPPLLTMQVVADNMKLSCRCHGLSGSCTSKTCWRELPSYYQIGDLIKEKYNAAVMVTVSHDDHRPATLYYYNTTIQQTVSPSDNRLVYLEEAANYCQHRENFTRGRQCLPSAFLESQQREQVKYSSMQEHFAPCEEFCCNGEFQEETISISDLCNCRFVWCCNVTCETCLSNVTKYHCTGWALSKPWRLQRFI